MNEPESDWDTIAEQYAEDLREHFGPGWDEISTAEALGWGEVDW